MTLREFFQFVENHPNEEPIYIFDNDVISKAPKLLENIRLPPMFK